MMLVSAALSGCADENPVACTAPREYWTPPEKMGPETYYNRLTLDRKGTAYWNGAAVSDAVLNQMLKTVRQLDPAPQLVLQTEMGLSCARLEVVRDKIDTLLDCRKNGRICSEGFRTPDPLPGRVPDLMLDMPYQ